MEQLCECRIKLEIWIAEKFAVNLISCFRSKQYKIRNSMKEWARQNNKGKSAEDSGFARNFFT